MNFGCVLSKNALHRISLQVAGVNGSYGRIRSFRLLLGLLVPLCCWITADCHGLKNGDKGRFLAGNWTCRSPPWHRQKLGTNPEIGQYSYPTQWCSSPTRFRTLLTRLWSYFPKSTTENLFVVFGIKIYSKFLFIATTHD